MDIQWYKNAVIYGLNVKTFQDSDGDGVGDFRGLIQRLDYLAELGITCLWLLPFYRSPDQDNGYDVSDYYQIEPTCGTLEDFRIFVKEAHLRGIRVIIDFVIHHTSNEHPWFEAARSSEKSIYRDYYVWTKKRPKTPQPVPAFPGSENDVWKYDKIAKAWYFHQFYSFQPDLNIKSRAVRDEILRVAEFWGSMGIDGVRIDAAGLLFAYKGIPYTIYRLPWAFLRKISEALKKYSRDAVLLGEADRPIREIEDYFGEGNRFQMLLSFLMNQNIFNALAAGSAEAVKKMLEFLPSTSPKTQWVNFVRNLDELNLNKLSREDQKLVYEKFGKSDRVKIYHRGIRRRPAPMFRNDLRRLRMVYALIFGLPGTPLICYGDEIGMGDELSLHERNAVRTPMQWSAKRNAGFSKAKPRDIFLPVISKGTYGYLNVNVESAKKNPDSLYHAIKSFIMLRRTHPIVGDDNPETLDIAAPNILGLKYERRGEAMIILFNFSAKKTKVELEDMKDKKFKEILRDQDYERRTADGKITLGPYGYRWFYYSSK